MTHAASPGAGYELSFLPVPGEGHRSIVIKALIDEVRTGINQGDHEDGVILVDAPLDERVLGFQIKNAELIDPERHDYQGQVIVARIGRTKGDFDRPQYVESHSLLQTR